MGRDLLWETTFPEVHEADLTLFVDLVRRGIETMRNALLTCTTVCASSPPHAAHGAHGRGCARLCGEVPTLPARRGCLLNGAAWRL